MRPRAPLTLLLSPLTTVVTSVCLPVAVIALFLVPFGSAAAGIVVSSLIGVVLGGIAGAATAEAARCSFVWTLPRFRRALCLGFVACDVAVAAVVGAILALTGVGDANYPLLAGVMTLATFSVGGALLLVPEASVLWPVAIVALFVAGSSGPAAVLRSPVAYGAAAFAVSVGTLWYAFSIRTFRWSSLTPGPVWSRDPIWDAWPTVPWWPRTRARSGRIARQRPRRARVLGTNVWRGVWANHQATRATRPFGRLTAWVLLMAVLGAAGRLDAAAGRTSVNWWILTFIGLTIAFASSATDLRATFPWSRRHRLGVACLGDLADTLWYLLVAGPAAVAIVLVVNDPAWSAIGDAARTIASTATLFPLAQWLAGPPSGGRPSTGTRNFVIGLVLVMAFTIWSAAVVSGLPRVAAAPAIQGLLLGILLLMSQIVNWIRLRRFFTHGDLVGEAA